MRHEYEIDQIMDSVYAMSAYSDVPVPDILQAIAPVVFDANDLDYINDNWDVKSEG